MCKLWVIDRISFKKVLENVATKKMELNRKIIEDISFFDSFQSIQKDAIAGVLKQENFKAGQFITI